MKNAEEATAGTGGDTKKAEEAAAGATEETSAVSAEEMKAEKAEETGDGADSPEPAASEQSTGSGKTGSAVGDVLPDFRTELLGGGEFHLADHRGEVVVINLWATTCAPCIEELPYYEKLKVEQPEVEILAIHHRAGAKKADEFLKDKGWDHLDFALDSKEKGLFTLMDAADAMPQTIVLNRNGEIVYNAQAPLTYEQLKALVEKAS